ncbi:MAG: shikimate kinase [Candidatus Odinarchaeia archaeon]
MGNKSTAVSHGAITVINAIASGIGSAIGIDLYTKATVEITTEKNITAEIINAKQYDTTLIVNCVRKVFEKFKIFDKGAKVTTESNIPIARGLKSSSAAANAVVLATVKALNKNLSDIDIIKLGVDAAIKSGVTITGAFDDASACYLGGLVLTDNFNRKIILRKELIDKLKVVLFIPKKETYTKDVNIRKIRLIKDLINPLVDLVKQNKHFIAMTLNGFIYSQCLGLNMDLIFKALESGVLSVSISGTGPSTAAIVKEDAVDKLVQKWSEIGKGEIKVVNINNKKAYVN